VDAETTKQVTNALKRIEGQVRGVQKMIDEDRYCIDVVHQVDAVRAALSRVKTNLLRQHLKHCVHNAMNSPRQGDQDQVIEELIDVFKH
jgi:DNA-binding FrmR family transcriptional regulator